MNKLMAKKNSLRIIKNSDRKVDITIHVMLLIMGLIAVYPLWFVLIASVSSPYAISTGRVLLWPVGLNLSAYKELLDNKDIWLGYRNTILYTALGTMINLAVQIPCAYAMSRKTLPGRRFFNTVFVITMYFSGGMIPMFLLVTKLGMFNSPLALVLPGAMSAYNMIIARSYFESNVPEELYDAARIDGCSYTGFFYRVVLPLSKAIISIIAMYSIQLHWNAYMTPKIYLQSRELFTLQQIVKEITATVSSSLETVQSENFSQYVALLQQKQLLKYAIIVVSAAPLVALYPFIQKFLSKGVMVGAVKG